MIPAASNKKLEEHKNMAKKIRAVVIRVGQNPEIVEDWPDGLEAMRDLVGGYVEGIRIAPGIHAWLNEEGKRMDLPLNFTLAIHDDETDKIIPDVIPTLKRFPGLRWLMVDHVVGNCVITGLDPDGETRSLTEAQAAEVMDRFISRIIFNWGEPRT